MPFPDLGKGNWLFLSHVMDKDTPAYGGGKGLEVDRVRDMKKGDSCNASMLAFSNHLGSHVDAPLHFVDGGKAVADFAVNEWIFTKPLIVDVPVEDGTVLKVSHFETALSNADDGDLLLIRTGFETKRNQDVYWSNAPAYDPELAGYFHDCLPSLKAVGLDTISIGSPNHRAMGHAVHQAFLGQGLRIFEDLALNIVPANSELQVVFALPLLFQNADGAPCTMIGLIKE